MLTFALTIAVVFSIIVWVVIFYVLDNYPEEFKRKESNPIIAAYSAVLMIFMVLSTVFTLVALIVHLAS